MYVCMYTEYPEFKKKNKANSLYNFCKGPGKDHLISIPYGADKVPL